MDYSKHTLVNLIEICKEKGIKGYSGKKKEDIIQLLSSVPPKRKAPQVARKQDRSSISLFSGAGGDSLGMKRVGYHVRAFSENKKPAIATHVTAFPECDLLLDPETKLTDIIRLPDEIFQPYQGQLEILFAGFPCQGFSHGGKKKIDDPRNELVHQFVRAANIIRPTYLIGENVPGLLSRKGKDPISNEIRPVIDIIRDLFAGIQYHITYHVLKATDAGVPQERKRLIIVGTRAEKGYPHMPWDCLVEPSSPKYDTIRPFLESHLEGAIEFPPNHLPDHISPHYWIATTETQSTGKPHPNLLRLAGGIRNRSTKEKEADGDTSPLVVEGGLISFGVRKSGYHGQILDPDKPSKTIICTYGVCPRLFVGLYNQTENKYWVRCLSVKELAQIQGFPADYPWQGNEKEIITQIGNAVPPRLCEQVVLSLPQIVYKDTPQYTDASDDISDVSDEEM